MPKLIYYITLFSILNQLGFAIIMQSFGQNKTKIQIINSNTLEFDELFTINGKTEKVRRLIGNVIFKQDSTYMYCDSAYMFAEKNSLNAYSNVHVIQGDSIHLYGDFLKYNGDNKHAELHNNVKLVDKDMTLYTNRMDYNLRSKVASYMTGGKIIDPENTLTSNYGYYFSKSKTLFFKDSVVLVNPNYTMYSDTLKYYPITKVAFFYGPTVIKVRKTIFIVKMVGMILKRSYRNSVRTLYSKMKSKNYYAIVYFMIGTKDLDKPFGT